MSVLPAVSRVFRKAFWADIYETVMCLPLALATFGAIFKPGDRTSRSPRRDCASRKNTIQIGMVWWLLALGVLTVHRSLARRLPAGARVRGNRRR